MAIVVVDGDMWIPLMHFFEIHPGFVYLLGSSLVFFDGYRKTAQKNRWDGFAWQLMGVVLLLIGLWASIYYKSGLSFFIVVFGLAVEISLMRRWWSQYSAQHDASADSKQ